MEYSLPSQRYPSATPQISRPWTQSQLSPQNTSAVRSTVEPSRSEHDVGVTSGPLYPLQNRFPTPAGRWMDPMMIRPIDSSYPSGSGAPPALDNHGPLLPSPFPPPSVHGQQFNSALPPLQPQFSGRDYYNPTPPSSASTSSSTSPSSMSSRSIDTLDSPITLQQTAQPSRYNHQHHHSDPYIYQSPAYSQDDLFHISRGPTFSQTSYAPYVVPLNPEVYDSGEGSNASSQTIDSFNSSLASSSPSTSRRKHRPSYSVGGGDEFDAFSQGLRTPRGARSKPSSPTTSRMSSVSPYQRRGPPVSRSSMSTLPFESAPLLTLDSSEGGSVSATGLRAPKPSVVHPFRTLPAHVQIDPQFPLLYRQFYVSSYFAPSDPLGNHVFAQHPEQRPYPLQRLSFNAPSHPLDLYTPRYVKGSGSDKVGLCPICVEPISRGGEGTKQFLKTKVSAYNYHMQYYHGICARSNAPFSPPLESRLVPRPRASIKERKEIKEGKCHVCLQWIPMQGTKDVEVMVKEIFWWKHAASCHKGNNIEGERDFFVEDDFIYQRIKAHQASNELLDQARV